MAEEGESTLKIITKAELNATDDVEGAACDLIDSSDQSSEMNSDGKCLVSCEEEHSIDGDATWCTRNIHCMIHPSREPSDIYLATECIQKCRELKPLTALNKRLDAILKCFWICAFGCR